MSINSLGMLGAVVTTSLSPGKTSETDRASTETSNLARKNESEKKAEAAAGVESMEKEASAGDRDADGRRMWEEPLDGHNKRGTDEHNTVQSDATSETDAGNDDPPLSKDATGLSGNNLDLSG